MVRSLSERIKHTFTSSHTSNQTPMLDNAIARLLTLGRIALWDSNLDLEYWEFALDHAAHIWNTAPRTRNQLSASPSHRWFGTPPDLTKWKTFGADVYMYQRVEQRPHGDKMEPTCIGGEGRFRYLDCLAYGVHDDGPL